MLPFASRATDQSVASGTGLQVIPVYKDPFVGETKDSAGPTASASVTVPLARRRLPLSWLGRGAR
jgi:hypothetical protein